MKRKLINFTSDLVIVVLFALYYKKFNKEKDVHLHVCAFSVVVKIKWSLVICGTFYEF